MRISDVNVGRLNTMAAMLDTIPAEDFTLERWVSRAARGPTKFLGLFKRDDGCGFAGCAMGWAAHNKIFNLEVIYDEKYRFHRVLYRHGDGSNYYGFDAAHKIFGINHHIASFFFQGDRYGYDYYYRVTPSRVAARIRTFVSKVEAVRARDRRKVVMTDISELKKLTEVKPLVKV